MDTPTAPAAEAPDTEPATAVETPVASKTDNATPNPTEQREELERQLQDPNWSPKGTAVQSQERKEEAEPEAPEPEPDVEDEPEAEAPEESEDEPEVKGIERPRFKDETDQLIAGVYKNAKESGKPISWAEAERRIKGDPQESEPDPEPVDPFAEQRTRLAEIDAKLDEAGEEGQLLDKDMVSLIRERSELVAELKAAEQIGGAFSKRDQAASEAKYRGEVASSVEESRKTFPTIAKKGSALHEEANEILAENDGAAWLNRPDAPMRAAKMAAQRLALRASETNGTDYATEYAKLTAAKAASVTASTNGKAPKAAPKATAPGAARQTTRTPETPRPESERFAETAKIADPRESYAALEAALYS